MTKTLIAALIATAAGAALAEYPEKPVTMVVPFAAGGPTDKVARDLAEAMRKEQDKAAVKRIVSKMQKLEQSGE